MSHNNKPRLKLHVLMGSFFIKLSEMQGCIVAMGTHEIEKRDVDHENLYLKVSE